MQMLPRQPGGLLQPLERPNFVWEDISMDFIVGLPSYQGNTVILVIVDRFSKATHLGMLPTNYTAYKTAELFTSIFCKHHGFSRSIISDRDSIFLSNFWKTLFKLHGTKLRMSSAYHPETDGQTEVVNRCLEQYLRSYVHDNLKIWGKFLLWAEWHYNTAIHSTTGFSPFEIVYGQPPPTIQRYIAGSTNLEALDTTLKSRDEILTILKINWIKLSDG